MESVTASARRSRQRAQRRDFGQSQDGSGGAARAGSGMRWGWAAVLQHKVLGGGGEPGITEGCDASGEAASSSAADGGIRGPCFFGREHCWSLRRLRCCSRKTVNLDSRWRPLSGGCLSSVRYAFFEILFECWKGCDKESSVRLDWHDLQSEASKIVGK
jgi:hypothetical protein